MGHVISFETLLRILIGNVVMAIRALRGSCFNSVGDARDKRGHNEPHSARRAIESKDLAQTSSPCRTLRHLVDGEGYCRIRLTGYAWLDNHPAWSDYLYTNNVHARRNGVNANGNVEISRGRSDVSCP